MAYFEITKYHLSNRVNLNVTNVSPENISAAILAQKIDQMPVDSRISYPCYKSFDEFIDIEKLKSLNEYISKKIEFYIHKPQEDLFLNAFRQPEFNPASTPAFWACLDGSDFA